MSFPVDEELAAAFEHWISTLPHDEVVRRYRALTPDERFALHARAEDDADAALESNDPYNERFENIARRFEVFIDGDDELPGSQSAEGHRQTAYELRHPEDWRKSVAETQEKNRLSDDLREAMALASSCWADSPVGERLERIEEVLPRLNQLADGAEAHGRKADETAIGEYIASLWRLRHVLREEPGE